MQIDDTSQEDLMVEELRGAAAGAELREGANCSICRLLFCRLGSVFSLERNN